MRRLARHLFTILSALSLLLCVAVCVLWVQSYLIADNFTYARVWDDGDSWATRWRGAAFGRGGVYGFYGKVGPSASADRLALYRHNHPAGIGWRWHDMGTPTDPRAWEPPRNWHERLGFFCDSSSDSMEQSWSIIFPLWMPAAALAVSPLAWCALKVRYGRRRAAGLCPACGYDLRASPDRCPECGTVPSVKATA
jgi:hypothetical protein